MPVDAQTGASVLFRVDGQLVFGIAGTREPGHPDGRFYAGIGGRRVLGETFADCARREAVEEMGVEPELRSAAATWLLRAGARPEPIAVVEEPAPLAIYVMPRLPSTRQYATAVYDADVHGAPRVLGGDELSALIALTDRQVLAGRRATIATLLDEGATLLDRTPALTLETRVFPVGAAVAASMLAHAGLGPSA